MKKLILLLVLSLLIFNSCTKESNPIDPDENEPKSGKISTGDIIDEISVDISPAGGTVIVSNVDSPINGLTITVPKESYNETRTYSVSYAEITEHELGEYFNPISPLITIKNGGGYSDEAFDVKIPISKADDEFAVGILYDEITGKIEVLPTISQDETSITVNTRHFATSTISSGTTLKKGMDLSSLGNLVISSLKESILSRQTVVSSGFMPGVDDWEFPNFGSYISPGGHCAGQSITAMWYYYEKTLKGEPSLFHRFDEVNNSSKPNLLWQDNPLGYRFASTIQKDFTKSDGTEFSRIIQPYLESLTWKAFITAILLTGEPQYVGIRESTTNSGHAMIVYKINISEGKMYVANPNYPNNKDEDGSESIGTIDYSNGEFKAYKASAKAGSAVTIYDQIAFVGKTAYVEWPQIAKRYEELQTGKIGNDRFPKYDIFMKSDNNEIGFYDGIVVETDTLKLFSKSEQCYGSLPGTDHYQPLYAYDEKTGEILPANYNWSTGILALKLNAGINTIGLYAMGGTAKSWEYLDFNWFTVYYQELSIEPNPLNSKPNEDCKFSALSNGTAPKGNSKYVWSFGDDTEDVTILNDSTVTHVFELEGTYTVSVELYDNSTNKKIGEAFGVANIVEKQIKEISIHVQPEEVTTLYTLNGNTTNFTYDYLFIDGEVLNRNGEIIGNTVSVSYDTTDNDSHTSTIIAITFDDIANPTNIVEFYMTNILTYDNGQIVSSSVSGGNIPFAVTDWGGYGISYFYEYEGDISQYLTEFEWKAESANHTEEAVSYTSQGKVSIMVEYTY
ncbi:MAG: PKD domain-containing protein [Melioribacteraceae bacterium]|nr:PKD domain-containing protein [Melioribacteraceae bacterium]